MPLDILPVILPETFLKIPLENSQGIFPGNSQGNIPGTILEIPPKNPSAEIYPPMLGFSTTIRRATPPGFFQKLSQE